MNDRDETEEFAALARQGQVALVSLEGALEALRAFVDGCVALAARVAAPAPTIQPTLPHVDTAPTQRPTGDAPATPGKKRTTCDGCNTKQYGVRHGLCDVCRALSTEDGGAT